MDRTAIVSLGSLREAVRRLGAQPGVTNEVQIRITLPDDRSSIDLEVVGPGAIEIPTL